MFLYATIIQSTIEKCGRNSNENESRGHYSRSRSSMHRPHPLSSVLLTVKRIERGAVHWNLKVETNPSLSSIHLCSPMNAAAEAAELPLSTSPDGKAKRGFSVLSPLSLFLSLYRFACSLSWTVLQRYFAVRRRVSGADRYIGWTDSAELQGGGRGGGARGSPQTDGQ